MLVNPIFESTDKNLSQINDCLPLDLRKFTIQKSIMRYTFTVTGAEGVLLKWA